MLKNRIQTTIVVVLTLVCLAGCKSPQETAAPATATPDQAQPIAGSQSTPTPIPPTPIPPTSVPPTPTPEPTATPTPTPTPVPVVANVGPAGGEVISADGRVTLIFPPDALDEEIQVSLTVREPGPDDGDVLSPIIDIETEPKLDRPLDAAALLSVNELPAGVASLQFARLMSWTGEIRGTDGPVPADLELNYWRPLMLTRIDENGVPSIPLSQFSSYAAVSMTLPVGQFQACSSSSSSGDDVQSPISHTAPVHICVPPAQALTPPTTPEGYVYVGTDVVINAVYQQDLSSVPLTRQGSPQDLVYISSETAVQDGTTGCDVIVAHVFAPLAPETSGAPEPCTPDPQALEPPDTPAGYAYVGRTVMVGHEIDTELSTVPLEREPKPTDLVETHSSTLVKDKVNECDIVVLHVFEPASSTGTSESCKPSEQMLTPQDPPDGFVYLGREVVINGVYNLDLSTAPLGRMHLADDLVMVSSSTKSSGGQVTCDIVVGHVFARADTTKAMRECMPSWQQLDAPPAPQGFVYVGRDVVINGEWSEQYSTVPLDRPESPQDINRISSVTQVRDGETVCDVIVRHVYAPISHSGCPLPDDLYTIPRVPPCHRYVGYNVVVNHHLVGTNVPLDRPFYPTDVVQIDSRTTVVDGELTCDVIVAYVFEPIPCPPCKTTVTCEIKPYAHEAENYTELYFPEQGNVSDQDRQTLLDLSISKPYEHTGGSFSIILPPGAEISQDGNQTTITLPDCQ